MEANASTTATLPTPKVNAPEKIPTPRFNDEKQIEYTINNHPILDTVAKKFNTTLQLKPQMLLTFEPHLNSTLY